MNSRDLLLAAKARMGDKKRSFQVGRHWFGLKKDDTTGTGCNIYFDDDQVFRKSSTGSHIIYEDGVNMCPIMDAIIVWFLYPDEAQKILEGYN
jgi:hypothetical protein